MDCSDIFHCLLTCGFAAQETFLIIINASPQSANIEFVTEIGTPFPDYVHCGL